jgi:solute carrier family 25 S-adenosylmethionine transporter 26
MAVDSILFPLDTIKTRLQARRQPQVMVTEAANIPLAAVSGAPRPFYRGLLSAMLGSFPAAATFWTVYELGKRHLTAGLAARGRSDLDFLAHGGAAALADVAVCAVRNPFEVVKQQMQLGLHSSTSSAFRSIVATDGILRGLYAGYFSTVLREIPFDAIEFALYEALKRRYRSYKVPSAHALGTASTASEPPAELVLWENAMLGSIAGGCAAAVTTPLDVVKTRLMTQTKVEVALRYHGWLDALSRISREEGAAALFSGIKPRVAWISMGGAIFIGSYEEAKRRLQAR